jgi:hypothetical protein
VLTCVDIMDLSYQSGYIMPKKYAVVTRAYEL